MPISHFAAGFMAGVTIRGVPLMQTHTGKVFWLGNNATSSIENTRSPSDGNPGTFNAPFSTLSGALSAVTSGRNDIIFIKPGHAETISSNTAVTVSKAGVAIIGLGAGSYRPTFTFDTAANATIGVTAATVSFKNCIFTANFADITAPFTIGGANYFTLESCYIKATATNMNFLWVVDTNATSNAADGLAVIDNKWIEPDLATQAMVKMDGTNNDINISDNRLTIGVQNNVATLMAIATTKVVTALRCFNNTVYRLNTDTATGGLLITTDVSTNTGIIANNFAQHADIAGEVMVTASSGFGFFENRFSGVAGATGYVLPAVDS